MDHLDIIKRNLFLPSEVKEACGFGGCFFISCKQSTERRARFLKDAQAQGLAPLWIEGIVPTDEEIKGMGFWERHLNGSRVRGQIGCAASHFMAITEAKRLGLESVLIFEDDATFIDEWRAKVEQLQKALQGVAWDLVYLGGVPAALEHPQIAPSLYESRGVWCTHAMAIHQSFYDGFLELAVDRIMAIDCALYHRAHKHRFLIYEEPLNFQEDGESIISGFTNLKNEQITRKAYENLHASNQ
jgi:GR25 family glycosyltransferase involved in LPS biosynthesis